MVFGAADGERGDAAARRDRIGAGTVRSLPQILAMALVSATSGARSPWGRFRLAVERFDEVLLELVAQRRRQPRGDSVLDILLEQRDEQGNAPSDRHLRDELVALLVGGHDSSAASLAWAFERLARNPAVHARLREGDPAYLDAVVKEVLRARPALTIAPRLLLAPARIAGHDLPAGRSGGGVPVAGDAARGPVAARVGVLARALARRAAARASRRGSRSAAACAAAPARRSPRWRCGRCCAPRRSSRSARPGPSRSGRGAACSS